MPAYFFTAAPNDGPLRGTLRLATGRFLRDIAFSGDDESVGITGYVSQEPLRVKSPVESSPAEASQCDSRVLTGPAPLHVLPAPGVHFSQAADGEPDFDLVADGEVVAVGAEHAETPVRCAARIERAGAELRAP